MLLYRRLPDLGMQLLLDLLLRRRLSHPSSKHLLRFGNQLFFSILNLIGMEINVLCSLSQGALLPDHA